MYYSKQAGYDESMGMSTLCCIYKHLPLDFVLKVTLTYNHVHYEKLLKFTYFAKKEFMFLHTSLS